MTIRSSNPLQGHGPAFWFLTIWGPWALFLICWGLYEIVNIRANYIPGIILTVIVAAVSAGIISGEFESGQFDILTKKLSDMRWELRAKLRVMAFVISLSTSVAVILLLVTMFAWISFALVQATLIEPTLFDSSTTTYSDFVSTYGWHLIDIIPGMNVEKTLGANPPVEFTGWPAGTPILMFRILTGAVIFNAIRRAWNKFTEIDTRLSGNKNTDT